jgi:hypothetical protein
MGSRLGAVQCCRNELVVKAARYPAQPGWWRQNAPSIDFQEEPIDFVGFSTISRSALQ